jgi:hypothetical protein
MTKIKKTKENKNGPYSPILEKRAYLSLRNLKIQK